LASDPTAPDPASAAKLTITQISAALTRARRRNIPEKAARIQVVLHVEHLGQPEVLTAAYAPRSTPRHSQRLRPHPPAHDQLRCGNFPPVKVVGTLIPACDDDTWPGKVVESVY